MSWRDTLFIWRGRFRRRDTTFPGEDDPSFDWQGTWIGVDAGGTLKPDAPEMEAFAEKGLPEFDVRGSLDPDRTDRTRASPASIGRIQTVRVNRVWDGNSTKASARV
jgi:hypothetical protein